LKTFPLGIFVSISIIHGQWSEVSITKVFTRVFGYLIVQELEVKTNLASPTREMIVYWSR
jgi:hypothetical protein